MHLMLQVHEKKKKKTSRILPEALVCEVLSRLPVNSLSRFKSICKAWQTLISDPYLVYSHLHQSEKRARSVLVLLLNSESRQCEINLYSYDLGSSRPRPARHLLGLKFSKPQLKMKYPSHCNGLVLLSTPSHIVVCNPSTRESITLPKGSKNVLPHPDGADRPAIVFLPSTKQYKVVRYFYRRYDLEERSCSLGLEVFTLGGETTDHSWRPLTAIDPPYPIFPSYALSLDGVIFWRIDNRLHKSSPKAILCYDMLIQEFKVIPLPPHPPDLDPNQDILVTSVELQGCLCLYGTSSSKANQFDTYIWLLKGSSSTDYTWIRAYTISTQQKPEHFLPVAVHDQKVLCIIDDSLCYYDPRTKYLETVTELRKELNTGEQPHIVDSHTFMHVKHYVESLVLIGPKVPK